MDMIFSDFFDYSIFQLKCIEKIFKTHSHNNADPMLPEFHGISGSQLAANAAFRLAVHLDRTRLNDLPGLSSVSHQPGGFKHIIQLDKLSFKFEFHSKISVSGYFSVLRFIFNIASLLYVMIMLPSPDLISIKTF